MTIGQTFAWLVLCDVPIKEKKVGLRSSDRHLRGVGSEELAKSAIYLDASRAYRHCFADT